jgi:hypothetical protein
MTIITERKEYPGSWWTPDKPDRRIPGVLVIDPNDDCILELMGEFNYFQETESIIQGKIKIRYGFSHESLVTLENCYQSEGEMWGKSGDSTAYTVLHVFIGKHFDSANEIKFKRITAELTHLNSWLGLEHIHNEKHDKEIFSISCDMPEVIFNVKHEDMWVSAGYGISSRGSRFPKENLTLEVTNSISIQFDNEKCFEDCLQALYWIETFLCFAVDKPVYPYKVTANMDENQNEIELFYFKRRVLPMKRIKEAYAFNMLFSYQDISENCEALIKTWFDKKEHIGSAVDLFLAVSYNSSLYLENMFLFMTRAFEAYHRGTHESKILEKGDFDKKIKGIIESVSSQEKRWLGERLIWCNEKSLRSRLKEIYEEHKYIISKFVKSKSSFIDKLVNTRNYYIHLDESNKSKKANPEDMMTIYCQLRSIMQVCFLHEIGMSNGSISEFMERLLKRWPWAIDIMK